MEVGEQRLGDEAETLRAARERADHRRGGDEHDASSRSRAAPPAWPASKRTVDGTTNRRPLCGQSVADQARYTAGVTAAAFHLVRERLRNQSLAVSRLRTPGEVVAWLGAAQAQDYAGAKWALGLRAKGLTDAAVEQAFDEGAILRTHILRPTWHFVAPADIRWMLALSAPRVHAVNAYAYRTFELDAAVLARSRAALERALAGGRQLTRLELAKVLQRAGVQADGPRLAHVMMHAELDAVICSGARRGKQFTYALLEERAPRAKVLPRDEALAELTRRYFASHGPATLRDYVWWSGLTARDARAGMADELARSRPRSTVDPIGSCPAEPGCPRQARQPTCCRTTTSI